MLNMDIGNEDVARLRGRLVPTGPRRPMRKRTPGKNAISPFTRVLNYRMRPSRMAIAMALVVFFASSFSRTECRCFSAP